MRKVKDNDKKIGKIAYFRGNLAKKLRNFSENMAKIDALFTKPLTFLIQILNFPPPPLYELPEKYTSM